MSRENRIRCLIVMLCCAAGLSPLIVRPLAEPIPATSPQDRVNAAYAAMGGDKLKTLSLTASLQQYDPGESYSLSDPAKPDTGVSDLKQIRDFQRGLTRDEWVRRKQTTAQNAPTLRSSRRQPAT